MYIKYSDFITENLILENLKNMKFVLSKRLIKILKKINHEICDELINLHNDLESETKQTFIDIHNEKDDYLTFIQANKASDLLNIDKDDYENIDKSIFKNIDRRNKVYKNYRGEMKIGRFINTIFGAGTFPISQRTDSGQKPKDIESFVRLYKSLHNQDDKFKMFEIVKGEKIPYWYNGDRYVEGSGTLGNSCMAGSPPSFFEMYEKNPDQISMLILYTDNSKTVIEGRAIIWELSVPENRTFMERVYVNDSSKEELFLEYAKKNGWMCKNRQSYGYSVDLRDTRSGWSGRMNIQCKLSYNDMEEYPFVDTMQFYNPDTGVLSNKKRGMDYELTSTDGEKYELYQDEDDYVYSNYHSDEIMRGEAKWCEIGEDWVYEDQAIYVFNSGGKYATPGHPDVVCMEIPSLDIKKHFLKTKSVWSDRLNTWVFKDSSKKVWLNKDMTSFGIDYKKNENKTFGKIGDDYYDLSLLEGGEDNYNLID